MLAEAGTVAIGLQPCMPAAVPVLTLQPCPPSHQSVGIGACAGAIWAMKLTCHDRGRMAHMPRPWPYGSHATSVAVWLVCRSHSGHVARVLGPSGPHGSRAGTVVAPRLCGICIWVLGGAVLSRGAAMGPLGVAVHCVNGAAHWLSMGRGTGAARVGVHVCVHAHPLARLCCASLALHGLPSCARMHNVCQDVRTRMSVRPHTQAHTDTHSIHRHLHALVLRMCREMYMAQRPWSGLSHGQIIHQVRRAALIHGAGMRTHMHTHAFTQHTHVHTHTHTRTHIHNTQPTHRCMRTCARAHTHTHTHTHAHTYTRTFAVIHCAILLPLPEEIVSRACRPTCLRASLRLAFRWLISCRCFALPGAMHTYLLSFSGSAGQGCPVPVAQ